MSTFKIKMEVDTNPPGNARTEVKTVLLPIPFTVKTLAQPDLLAGKIHAILCRPWQTRVKGRDWYDLVWYVARDVPVNLPHLSDRLVQSKAWAKGSKLSTADLLKMLSDKISQTDFDNAKADVRPFIQDKNALDLGSGEFFLNVIQHLKIN